MLSKSFFHGRIDHWFNFSCYAMGYGILWFSCHQISWDGREKMQKCLPQTNFPTLRHCLLPRQPWVMQKSLEPTFWISSIPRVVWLLFWTKMIQRIYNKKTPECIQAAAFLSPPGDWTNSLRNLWVLVVFLGTPCVYFLIYLTVFVLFFALKIRRAVERSCDIDVLQIFLSSPMRSFFILDI